MGSDRGQNDKTYALHQELGRHFRVDQYAEMSYIYKRNDKSLKQSFESRPWQVRVPIPNSRGILENY